MCVTVPSLVCRSEAGLRTVEGVGGGGEGICGSVGAGNYRRGMRALRVATWNIAGGQRSAQAPDAFNAQDQRAAVMAEVMRWGGASSGGCDIIALQECEAEAGYEELLGRYALAGCALTREKRGYVHLYVRRDVKHTQLELDKTAPCVAVRVEWGADVEHAESLVAVAVHLPTGDSAGKRQRI